MKAFPFFLYLIIASLLFFNSCETTSQKPRIKETPRINSGKVFDLLPSDSTGVDFNNVLVESEEINFYKYQYLYNGGGVGIGDINNDGLSDIYFTGTVADDKLYLNKGDMKFEDITITAGIKQNNGLKTGVSMVDINNDGYLDIYVSRSGWYEDPSIRANLLYENQGDNTFLEKASQYGLAETGNTVQTAFFDYDKDGDLDCYMANHPLFSKPLDEMIEEERNPSDRYRDKLYRNNGNNTYTEVSKSSGINNYGHGLGLAISDFNHDGWPDIYVANDFEPRDFYYINNKNGTFTEDLQALTGHISYFAMGSDAADINNDGLLDLFVVEMLAEDNKRQKTNMAPMNPEKYWAMVRNDKHYQFMRNTLQLNIGRGSFVEIANISGLAKTDWSWAPLFADFDHDGKKDLAVANGYLYDTQDKDLWPTFNQDLVYYAQIVPYLKSTRIQNYVFKNEGDYHFSDQSEDWGFNFSGYSNGMAYGDLDNDGDLDLVVNNINDPASIYKNTISDRKLGHYLLIELEGPPQNIKGLGTKITLITEVGIQFQEFWVARGFESSCDQKIHFGIVEGDYIKQLKVEWPDGKVQIIDSPEYDQLIKLQYEEAVHTNETKQPKRTFFSSLGVESIFTHRENYYDDYEKELLLPHKQSQNGPKIAVGDINGDEIEDFYIGGAHGQAGRLIVNVGANRFAVSSMEIFQLDSAYEDIGATFFDADGDGDLDLYVVSGGNEFEPNSPLLQDRLYLNDGRGLFQKDDKMLPKILVSGGVVKASDFDSDGDQDLFVGGRLTPGKYPFAPRSYILRNEGDNFVDVTESVSPDLMNPGLITSAVWSDFSGDGQEDLIIVGEWTGILMFKNEDGKLIKVSKENGMENETGWWNAISSVDIDNDGDQDYIVGNLGLNYKYYASKEEPLEIYAHDFDENGSIDIVLGYYNDGICYPVRGRQCSSEQMPILKEKFKTYEEFGEADMKAIYGEKLEEALHLRAYNFASSIMINEGKGQFTLQKLPTRAQFAPINGIITSDFDQNGTMDILVAGNLFQAEIETGRADAGVGLLMLGDGKTGFTTVPFEDCGFYAPMDVKDLALLNAKPNQPKLIVVANNNYSLQIFAENKNL